MPDTLPTPDRQLAAWLSAPSPTAAEIARQIGFGAIYLDVEHGAFDLADLDRFVPFVKAIGLELVAKVLAPERGPIQQALDFGADAIVIPHIDSAAHAREVCSFAKFPPLGDRSFAGGRTASYGGFDDAWVAHQDSRTRCYAMIEAAGALEEVEQILALPTVDGAFVGPSDLSLSRGRGAYTRTPADFADLERVAKAAAVAGKPWVFPAWARDEQEFALQHGAAQLVVAADQDALFAGMQAVWDAMEQLRAGLDSRAGVQL